MELRKNRVFIVSAPSGAGKTTLTRRMLARYPQFAFSVSATTRKLRGTEQDGVDYYFISAEEFIEKRDQDYFLEWEEVYDGMFYGTPRSEIERIFGEGKIPLLDLDVVGGVNVKKEFGDEAVSFFIRTPSLEVLRERLIQRGTDSPEAIEKRCKKATWEMRFADKFDYVIVNDDLENATKALFQIIDQYLEVQHS
jgi:guanylate kinase